MNIPHKVILYTPELATSTPRSILQSRAKSSTSMKSVQNKAGNIALRTPKFGDQTQDFHLLHILQVGKDPATKSDEFLEKFQTAFDPPPSFLEIISLFLDALASLKTMLDIQ